MTELPNELNSLDPRTASENDLGSKIKYNEDKSKWIYLDPSQNKSYEFNEVMEKWSLINNEDAEDQTNLIAKKKQKLLDLKAEKLKKQLLLRKEQRENTSIYVSSLPIDIDLAELKQIFSKYGVISEDLLTNKPKIKLYQDEQGKFKGDALITYLKPESVSLAIQMLDDTKISSNNTTIKVQRAQFTERTDSDSSEKSASKRTLTEQDKKVIKKKIKAMHDKIEDWNGDDNSVNPKWSRTVILKRVFTLKELKEDRHAKNDIIEDIKEGCGEVGTVSKVVLFDLEEEGVVLVRFENADDAAKCVEKMDGRFFGGQKLIALKYNGEHFNRTESSNQGTQDDDESVRLNSFIDQNS